MGFFKNANANRPISFATTNAFKNLFNDEASFVQLEGDVLKEYQIETLSIVKDIAFVCEENNILYQLGGGSALGAIRHGGFIPWDDDMDLNMKGSQIDIFTDVFSEKFKDKYIVETPQTKGHGQPVVKIRQKDSVARTFGDIGKHECGIYVDVCKLENVYDNPILQKLHGILCMGFGFALSCSNFYKNREFMLHAIEAEPEVGFVFKTKIFLGFLLSFLSTDKWAALTDNCYGLCKNEKSRYMCIPSGRKHYFGEIYERSDMENTVVVPFEDTHLRIPRGYNAYLTKLYGDYMQIPPVEKREKHILLELKFHDNLAQ